MTTLLFVTSPKMDQLFSSSYVACSRYDWQLNLCKHRPSLDDLVLFLSCPCFVHSQGSNSFLTSFEEWDQIMKNFFGRSHEGFLKERIYENFVLKSFPLKIFKRFAFKIGWVYSYADVRIANQLSVRRCVRIDITRLYLFVRRFFLIKIQIKYKQTKKIYLQK